MNDKTFIQNVRALNNKQLEFIHALKEYPVVFGIGPAGTGKTYLSVVHAVKEYDNKKVNKIILVRPAVATESLGYLPGDLNEKLDPYMIPLFETLQERWGKQKVKQLMDNGNIEVAPLAFMRGRTFHNCVLIFDEAQNCTLSQMKLLLTRMGDNIKCMINGDISQSDLSNGNGLSWAIKKLTPCPSVRIIKFEVQHIVRSELAKQMVEYLENNKE